MKQKCKKTTKTTGYAKPISCRQIKCATLHCDQIANTTVPWNRCQGCLCLEEVQWPKHHDPVDLPHLENMATSCPDVIYHMPSAAKSWVSIFCGFVKQSMLGNLPCTGFRMKDAKKYLELSLLVPASVRAIVATNLVDYLVLVLNRAI